MAIQVVNRERELRLLNDHADHLPGLVVLRGRRRVGKSFLLRTAFAGRRIVSFQAEQQPVALQLESFARECARLLPGEPPLVFVDWRQALGFVEAQAREAGPLVIVIDEFQRVAGQDSGLESLIQNVWDRWDHDQVPALLVLSGSALGFMSGLFRGGKPTHGRSVYRPLLLPIGFRDVGPFGPVDASPGDIVERFSVLGGTPQYQRWAGRRSLRGVLMDVVLAPDGPLYDEPEHLIREEDGIRERGPYFGVMEAIARGCTDPTRIGAMLQISSQLATKFLARLAELGYVARVEPVEPHGGGRARGYWRISDPFFHFWFAHVRPNRSRLVSGRVDEVADDLLRNLPARTGIVFEDCCREWVAGHSELGRGAIEVGSWWSRRSDVEIDVAAVGKQGYTLLGSCKWTRALVGVRDLDELRSARGTLGAIAHDAELVLFSKAGFTDQLRELAAPGTVHLIDVDSLFT